MPTTITGDPTTVSNGLSRTITNATNASPIVATTSVAHGFATGDTVQVSGVVGNTAANDTWSIIKLSSTTFSLTGSTGSGAYVSGGTAIDVSLTPQFQGPADSDVLDAASVNPAFEALADRTQFLALIAKMRSKAFTADTTWDAPTNVQPIGILVGGGGGGAGGAGSPGDTVADDQSTGGGGGGGAIESVKFVTLTGGMTYTIDIGAGGSGATGLFGNDGADTTFSDSVPTVLARFKGASGGGGGIVAVPSATDSAYAGGGAPVAGANADTSFSYVQIAGSGALIAYIMWQARKAQQGGPSPTKNGGNGHSGNASPQGYSGGAGGTSGTTSGGTREGGGGGGGGGGGFAGAGGAGGAGGNGAAVTGVAGSNGTAAAANTGAGGGGGGAGGGASTTPGAGGTGGAGGSGKLTLYYFGDPT